ncbi:hypothetical protein GCM10025857_11100 [Alicyclobacillus contaminans]|uniref:DMT family transporter n=1 Tax=Alicyclobacillus contaminans TaxID=392016 RepID=UPI0004285F9B|nr:DMT family transporter [Alicyclobacillus contaminans]GMA49753.1 hypothetical protein GCM10025857_11100 [Alicyclobacillus contaminans]
MPGELTALLCALCYALTYIFLNKAQADGQTVDDGLLPVLVVSVMTLGGAFAMQRALSGAPLDLLRVGYRPVLYCAAGALLATFLGRLCLFAAISQLGATRSVVIKSLAPAVTVILAVVFLGESPDLDDWLGFILLGGSIVLLVLEKVWTRDERLLESVTARGIALALLSAGLQGGGHIMRKLAVSQADTLPPLLASAFEVLFALAFYVIYLMFRGRLVAYARFYLRRFNLYLLAAGVVSSTAVLLFFSASRTVPVSTVAVLVGLQPVVVVVVSSIFFRGLERITWLTYVYVLCMVVGVTILVR